MSRINEFYCFLSPPEFTKTNLSEAACSSETSGRCIAFSGFIISKPKPNRVVDGAISKFLGICLLPQVPDISSVHTLHTKRHFLPIRQSHRPSSQQVFTKHLERVLHTVNAFPESPDARVTTFFLRQRWQCTWHFSFLSQDLIVSQQWRNLCRVIIVWLTVFFFFNINSHVGAMIWPRKNVYVYSSRNSRIF